MMRKVTPSNTGQEIEVDEREYADLVALGLVKPETEKTDRESNRTPGGSGKES